MRLIDADKIDFTYGGLSHIWPNDFIGIAKYFSDKVKAMPTVDAASVVHGRWIAVGVNCKCSYCHTVRKTDTARDHFCPNCGAKMDLPDGE